jgi:hypothetical protein
MKLGQLAQQLLGPLVLDLGSLDHHFDLIAALVFAFVENALLAQPNFLPRWAFPAGFQQLRPSMVGTSIFAPRPDSATLTGTLISILSVAMEERMLLYTRVV